MLLCKNLVKNLLEGITTKLHASFGPNFSRNLVLLSSTVPGLNVHSVKKSSRSMLSKAKKKFIVKTY